MGEYEINGRTIHLCDREEKKKQMIYALLESRGAYSAALSVQRGRAEREEAAIRKDVARQNNCDLRYVELMDPEYAAMYIGERELLKELENLTEEEVKNIENSIVEKYKNNIRCFKIAYGISYINVYRTINSSLYVYRFCGELAKYVNLRNLDTNKLLGSLYCNLRREHREDKLILLIDAISKLFRKVDASIYELTRIVKEVLFEENRSRIKSASLDDIASLCLLLLAWAREVGGENIIKIEELKLQLKQSLTRESKRDTIEMSILLETPEGQVYTGRRETKTFILKLEWQDNLGKMFDDWLQKIGAKTMFGYVGLENKIERYQGIISKCRKTINSYDTLTLQEAVDDVCREYIANESFAGYKEHIQDISIGVLYALYGRAKQQKKEKEEREKRVKERREKWRITFGTAMKPAIIIAICVVLMGGVSWGTIKWGFPLSDKEILDSAIQREFMFKELHMSSRSATKILMRDHMLEDYISLARQEADIVQYARLRRYLDSRSSDSLKSTIYHWNYKLNE